MDEKSSWVSAFNTSFINFMKMNRDKEKKSNVFTKSASLGKPTLLARKEKKREKRKERI